MNEAPNPAQIAKRHQEALDRTTERERVKAVRQRRRKKNSAPIASHIDQQTLTALAKHALPDKDQRARRR